MSQAMQGIHNRVVKLQFKLEELLGDIGQLKKYAGEDKDDEFDTKGAYDAYRYVKYAKLRLREAVRDVDDVNTYYLCSKELLANSDKIEWVREWINNRME